MIINGRVNLTFVQPHYYPKETGRYLGKQKETVDHGNRKQMLQRLLNFIQSLLYERCL